MLRQAVGSVLCAFALSGCGGPLPSDAFESASLCAVAIGSLPRPAQTDTLMDAYRNAMNVSEAGFPTSRASQRHRGVVEYQLSLLGKLPLNNQARMERLLGACVEEYGSVT